MPIFKILLLTLLSFCFGYNCYCQYNVVSKYYKEAEVLYNINDSNLKKYPNYYFTDFNRFYLEGYKPFNSIKNKRKRKTNSSHTLSYIIELPTTIKCHFDSTYFKLLVYVENIDEIEIRFCNQEDFTYSKIVSFSNIFYQMPILEKLSEFKQLKLNNDSILNFLDDSINIRNEISKIELIIKPKKDQFELVIGNLSITNLMLVEKEYNHPFFDKITERNSISLNTKNSLSRIFDESPLVISHFGCYSEPINGEFYIKPVSESFDSIQLLKKICDRIIENYPFYAEKSICKSDKEAEFKSIINNTSNYTNLKDSVREFLNRYYDPHLFIPQDKSKFKEKKMQPIRFFEINNEILIAAIFDTTLYNNMKIGDRLIEINKNPINFIIDSLSGYFKGTEVVRRHKAISEIMNNLKDSSFIRYTNTNDDTLELHIIYNKKNIKISSNFIPKHCEVKPLDNSIFYFRINNFEQDVWTHFINNYSKFKNSKGLIMDVRGNGGGDEGTVLKLVSCFLDKCETAFHVEIPGMINSMESAVIKPNEYFHLKIPVYILVDKRTACASELFAYLMKKYDNSILFGDSKTSGTYAWRSAIVLPDGFKIYHNCLAKVHFSNNYIIEGEGIDPDVWIWRTKVNDLYPYEDKVLKTAYTYLINNLRLEY